MSIFTKIKEEFLVNWKTVMVGWGDAFQHLPLIAFDEIKEFAFERLESSDCTQSEEDAIIQLLSKNQNEFDKREICDQLVTLSHFSNAKITVEERKWRVALLDLLLADIPSDPLYGTMALYEFWSEYNYPADAPQIILELGDSSSAYGSDRLFQELLSIHKKWINTKRCGYCRLTFVVQIMIFE